MPRRFPAKGWRAASTLFALAVLGACASTSTAVPTIAVTQTSRVGALTASPGTAVPVDFRLAIANPLEHPVTLTSVEIETVGVAGGYQMRRVRHRFDRTIPPKSSDSIEIRAWVQPLQVSQDESVVTSVIVRGVAQFDSAAGPVKSGFTARLNQ